jgi:hypothetical protein
MERERRQIQIRGIVIPVEWDAKGNAIKAALLTADEGEYLVEENTMGRKLLGMVQRVVEVRGLVRVKGGRKIITVEDYRSEL